MASHRLEDDLGYSPVNEVRRVWLQESAEDQEQESMTCIALIGSRCRCHYAEECPIREPRNPDVLIPSLMELLVDVLSRYVEKTGELTLDGCERVRHEDALGHGRRPLDECRVLLDHGGQLRPLEVEYCVLGIPKFGGGPQKDPIHRGLDEHDHISDDVPDESVIHRPESPPNTHDVLSWWRDRFESETGSRAGWGLPIQGCEFLEIERGSLGAGSME
ncbi:hypothetical protein CRG98_011806 [Punica granatum]|uniref:Uncharacterized protein n=1 Tax=Punica granatum TaxID=22663 RepID=A0A2I0KI24_PUNGR|nr:hypothetical protein CRG98_011806 [Punica granatum]